MPSLGKLQKPFLAAGQELWVDYYEDVASGLELPEDGADDETIDGLSQEILSEFSHGLLEHVDLGGAIPKMSSSYQELEARLQWSAQKDRLISANFKAIGKVAAIGTGVETVLSGEDAMEVLYGYEFGYNIIRFQAQRDLGTLLIANVGLKQAYDKVEGDASVWYRAIVAHENNPRIRPPVSIDVAEEERINVLERKALESFTSAVSPIKLSSSYELNASRLDDFYRQTELELSQDPNNGTFEQLNSLAKTIEVQGIPDFNDSEINEGFRKIHRLKRYLLSAFRGDPTIAEDPRSRYFLYLSDNLSLLSLKLRFGEYDREVSKYTRLQKRAMLRGQADET
jgi:hypothetical protein